jgi:DNA (cytosine-5)-methyltransferase 1
MPWTFIDLFAGIGGFRIALERLGGHCVFSSEWNEYAQRTYGAWFGETPHGDINSVAVDAIPGHDVLAAGFPP